MFGFKKTNVAREPAKGKTDFLARLKIGLSKTQSNLFDGLHDLTLGKNIDATFLHDLEERLLLADVGIATTTQIIAELQTSIKRDQINDQQQLWSTLAKIMANILKPLQQPLVIPDHTVKPLVILLTGINGAGKTTTAGKLSHHFMAQGYNIMLAAGDTFRAAAVEQLQVWGGKNNVPVIAQAKGADPAAVIYDALQSAQKNKIDILIADTAGRLHTEDNLMHQLKKIHRTIGKFNDALTVENMLVLDGTTGQNALSQAKLFNDAIGINGIVLTKLDGSAKGGVIFALARQIGIPVRFISVGEKIDDLQPFDSNIFVAALLEHQ